jgi:hypothetical protein
MDGGGYDGLVDFDYKKHFRVHHGKSEFAQGNAHNNQQKTHTTINKDIFFEHANYNTSRLFENGNYILSTVGFS